MTQFCYQPTNPPHGGMAVTGLLTGKLWRQHSHWRTRVASMEPGFNPRMKHRRPGAPPLPLLCRPATRIPGRPAQGRGGREERGKQGGENREGVREREREEGERERERETKRERGREEGRRPHAHVHPWRPSHLSAPAQHPKRSKDTYYRSTRDLLTRTQSDQNTK